MFNNGRFNRIETILEKVYRDYKFTADVNWSDVLEWTGEAMRLIGAPTAFIEKVTDGNSTMYHPKPIEIEDYKGKLPTDIIDIIQVREYENKIPMRRTTETFFEAYYCQDSPDNSCVSDYTYKVNQNYIFTSFKEGCVELYYRSFATDERGYPLIPDNERYMKGITSYIGERIAFGLFLQGDIAPAVYSKIDQERDWYIGSAKNSMIMPDYDTMENWKNMFVRLIPNVREHDGFYKHTGEMERRYNKKGDL